MSNSVPLTFDYNLFILTFPEFDDPIKYPEERLQIYWDQAIKYISNVGNYGTLQGEDRQFALNLMTAHIAFINDRIKAGNRPIILTNGTVDKATVAVLPPPTPNGWRFFLNTSGYGLQLIALLEVRSAGVYYIPGGNYYGRFC